MTTLTEESMDIAVSKIAFMTTEAKRLGVDIDFDRWIGYLSPEDHSIDSSSMYFALNVAPYGKVRIAAWAQEATISLKMNPSENPRATCGCQLEAEVSWSSCGRNVAQAMLAIKVYERAIEFAAACEGIWNT